MTPMQNTPKQVQLCSDHVERLQRHVDNDETPTEGVPIHRNPFHKPEPNEKKHPGWHVPWSAW